MGLNSAFVVSERVHKADERCPLAGEILKPQQCKSACAGRAQVRFGEVTVEHRRQLSGGGAEIGAASGKPRLRKKLLKILQIARL